MFRHSIATLAICALTLASAAAHASVNDRAIDAARQCTKHFSKNERVQGIPTHLLAAIASTESGRWNKTLGMALPWPWAINAEGKAFYMNSKAEAIRKVRSLQKQGIKSIDVGCMQVNLKHHPRAFANLAQAFDPKYNVAYAAKFLRSNYNEKKSWTKATANYHSRTKKFGDKYLSRVEKVWSKIVGRVRKARAKRGLAPNNDHRINVSERLAQQSEMAMSDEFASEVIAPEGGDVDKLSSPRKTASAKKAKLKSTQPTMRVIELSDKRSSQRANVMVIRPTSHITKEETIEAPVQLKARNVASAPRDLFVMDYRETRAAPKSVTSHHDSFKNQDSGATMPHFVFVD